MGINATDKNRSLFLKGFNLSNSGANEDPTYLGFKFVFDFGALPINAEHGWAPSPLLRIPNYTTVDGGSTMPFNMFGQPQYDVTNSNVLYYSAYNYLLQRDGSYFGGNALKRANALKQFQILLSDINNNSPWFFQSIDGLEKLDRVALSGFQDELGLDSFDPARTNGKFLTINCLESLNLRMTTLANLYNQATFDAENMKWLVPRNLRKFTMWIYVTEIRNFFKTTRLTGASSVVSQLDDLSSLLTTDRNPGGSLANTPEGERQPSGPGAPGNAFNSFARGVLSQSGLMNEVDSFRNQQDQSGIKPVLIYELGQCEFDFSLSTPLQTSTNIGTQQPTAATQSFRIHVGRVKMKTQYPNIRTDNSYLVLADGYDQNRSSVQIYDDSLDLETIASLGREALTNITSQAITDLINEGISQYVNPALSGIDQSSLGNIYSFNPSQLARLTNQGGQFGFNNAQNFLNGASDTGIDNVFKGNLPTPQSMGLGGPPDRIYPIIQTENDVYSGVPGPDLGVPDRVYPAPGGDVYSGVPGTDLGVPDRVYPAPGGDVYPGVPGPDLGVPDRIYPAPGGDVYPGVPGPDLGVPDRIYPDPGGDVYSGVPGSDLGVPDRVYPAPGGDVYPDVPGRDLGVPGRVYPDPTGDVYPDVPGPDLGVPDRVYSDPAGDVYPNSPGRDLGVPDRVYSPPAGDVYPTSPGRDLGVPDRVYADPAGDVYPTVPGGDLGVPDRVYKDPSGKVYPDPAGASIFPGQDIGKVYSPETLISSGSELRSPENTFSSPPSPVYAPPAFNYQRGEIGKIYPPTSGDFIAMAPIDLGNTKGPDKFNISLGTLNPPDQTDSPTSSII
jgi:hypothetical protein